MADPFNVMVAKVEAELAGLEGEIAQNRTDLDAEVADRNGFTVTLMAELNAIEALINQIQLKINGLIKERADAIAERDAALAERDARPTQAQLNALQAQIDELDRQIAHQNGVLQDYTDRLVAIRARVRDNQRDLMEARPNAAERAAIIAQLAAIKTAATTANATVGGGKDKSKRKRNCKTKSKSKRKRYYKTKSKRKRYYKTK